VSCERIWVGKITAAAINRKGQLGADLFMRVFVSFWGIYFVSIIFIYFATFLAFAQAFKLF
jgi:hypothetical protein